jgi:hypothetical protein
MIPSKNTEAIWNQPSLRNLGIVAHHGTIKASMLASSASHLERVKEFFQSVIENEQFIIFALTIITIYIPSIVLSLKPKPNQSTQPPF